MKLVSFLATFVAITSARPEYASGSIPAWHPAGPGDLRSPCPGLNIAANYGFFPHDGKNITEDIVIKGLGDAYNVDPELSKILFKSGAATNPEPNATWFSLAHLRRHNLIEHDASLTRADAYTGNNWKFNPQKYAMTRQYWTEAMVKPIHMANARIQADVNSKAFNPEYNFTSERQLQAAAEPAAPLLVLGDRKTGYTDRRFVEMFFEQEKLPYELGWRKKEDVLTMDDLTAMTNLIADKISLFSE
ncbi:Cloroperoxidase [Polyplosphaeria fusca]|uniref:Cloroperoxidase n=1 Tax=Polyplosphaeria fusca TaxID=682080 RepID=A0A9P4QP07_9PLEO|nr:Cloroperoxidase [Polyplosphaeria fusca]